MQRRSFALCLLAAAMVPLSVVSVAEEERGIDQVTEQAMKKKPGIDVNVDHDLTKCPRKTFLSWA